MSDRSELYGVKGWLLFLVVSMMAMTPLSIFIFGYSSFHVQELINHQLKSVNEWQALKNAILFFTIIFSIVSMYGGYRLYRGKTSDAVTHAIWSLWLTGFGFAVASTISIKYHADVLDIDYLIKSIISSTVHAGIWTLYLIRSKRVCNTYHRSSPDMSDRFISSFKHIKNEDVSFNQEEERLYELIANEIERGNVNKGLWTKFFAEHEGNELKIKSSYIKKRYEMLIKESMQLSDKDYNVTNTPTAKLSNYSKLSNNAKEDIEEDNLINENLNKKKLSDNQSNFVILLVMAILIAFVFSLRM